APGVAVGRLRALAKASGLPYAPHMDELDGALETLKWDDAGLVTVVVQDRFDGELRMLAHANAEALHETLRTGEAHFFSRSRQALWRKGETSGNVIRVVEVWVDCDGDALVYLAEPCGPSCHTGRPTCFFRPLGPEGFGEVTEGERAAPVLGRLEAVLAQRKAADDDGSYTARLLRKGPTKIAAKVREEGGELADALERESDARVVSETADVVYHVLVGLLARGLSIRDVEAELARRFGVGGLVEKASRGG
ncbi:MAG: bifunctional phosphoribosyl-AMP cyclohydrolase/phosphoribosyl-ATP diphosphatase HisIE, partial [Myxococcota bacterium]